MNSIYLLIKFKRNTKHKMMSMVHDVFKKYISFRNILKYIILDFIFIFNINILKL